MTDPATASEYLVNHGHAAFLGRFRNGANTSYSRGDRVVVRSARGIEAATILSEAAPRFARLIGIGFDGEILRPLTHEDRRQEENLRDRALCLLGEIEDEANESGLPVLVLDLEILLEGSPAILQVLPSEDTDLTPLIERLTEKHQLPFVVHDVRTKSVEPEPEGCGKPGCGSSGGGCTSCGTGGGCSTGGCSSGKVKSAEELTNYFADLRRQMEEQTSRVSLHG